MSRTSLLLVLALAAIVGATFAAWPELDLRIAGLFYDPSTGTFVGGASPGLAALRTASMWLPFAFPLAALGSLALKVLRPQRPPPMPVRAAVFLIATFALAPGLLVNGILKEHWGRPRPVAVSAFGGAEPFMPWWQPGGMCPANCSFVSGEGAAAFSTLAAAALAPPPWRPLAYGAALAFGAGVGLIRMAAGGHFLTDVVFAGVFTYLLIWVAYAVILRPRRQRDPMIDIIPPRRPARASR